MQWQRQESNLLYLLPLSKQIYLNTVKSDMPLATP